MTKTRNYPSTRKAPTIEPRECVVCSNIFTPTGVRSLACSTECTDKYAMNLANTVRKNKAEKQKLECEAHIEELLQNGFKPHPTIPDIYVSIEGEVWSYSTPTRYSKASGEYTTFHHMNKLKFSPSKFGYLQAGTVKNDKQYVLLQHRVIMETFRPSFDPTRQEIDHMDGDKQNNNINNLRWASRTENVNNPVTRVKTNAAIAAIDQKAKVAKYQQTRARNKLNNANTQTRTRKSK